MLRGLGFGSDWPRERGIELVDDIGRKDMTLAHGQELIVSDIKSRPKAKSRIIRAGAEIELVAAEQRILGRDVVVDSGNEEILWRGLRAHIVVNTDIGVDKASVGKRV